jgi:hypothetical protein
MEEQSYAKHMKFVPLFHGVLSGIILLTFLGSLYAIYRAFANASGRLDAVLITALTVIAILLFWFCRTFPLKAQDRAIRAEENLRHFALTGKLLDKRLSLKQIIGLRFASDGEFPALAQRAADENLTLDDIKRAIKSWRADNDRL